MLSILYNPEPLLLPQAYGGKNEIKALKDVYIYIYMYMLSILGLRVSPNPNA